MDGTKKLTSTDQSASCRHWHRLCLHTPDAELFGLVLEPASVLAARQLVDDAHQERTRAPRLRHGGTAPGHATGGDADTVVGLAEGSTRTAPNTSTTISLTSAVRARTRDATAGRPGGADECGGGRGRTGLAGAP